MGSWSSLSSLVPSWDYPGLYKRCSLTLPSLPNAMGRPIMTHHTIADILMELTWGLLGQSLEQQIRLKRPWRHKPAFQFGISWLIGRLCPSTPKKASVSILWRPLAVLARVRRMVAAHQATTPFNNQPGRNLDRRKFRRIISRRKMSRWESLYLPCQLHTSPCGLVLTHWLSNFWDQTIFFFKSSP